MFFRRNEGEYRETDRVTRFKLIKSGKQWLRAATSNFDFSRLLRVVPMHRQFQHKVSRRKHQFSQGKPLLKGYGGRCSGWGSSSDLHCSSGRNDNPALESQVTANQDVTANSGVSCIECCTSFWSVSSSLNKSRVYKLFSWCSGKHRCICISVTISISISISWIITSYLWICIIQQRKIQLW